MVIFETQFIIKAGIVCFLIAAVFFFAWRRREVFLNTEVDLKELSDEELEKYRKKLYGYYRALPNYISERFFGDSYVTKVDNRAADKLKAVEREMERRFLCK